MPPTFNEHGSLVKFANALLEFQHTESIVHRRYITDMEITRRFLEDIQTRGYIVNHHISSLAMVAHGKSLPPNLHVAALAPVIPDHTFTGPKPMGHRVNTRQGNRHNSQQQHSNRTRPTGAFYKPDKDAFCDACSRPAHEPINCFNFAKFVAMQDYATKNPDVAAKVLDKFRATYNRNRVQSTARALQVASRDPDLDYADFLVSEEIDDLLEQDFINAGQM
jgi:hypothetical protein